MRSHYTKLQNNIIALSENYRLLPQTPRDRLDSMNAKLRNAKVKKRSEFVEEWDNSDIISHNSNFVSPEKPIRNSSPRLTQKTHIHMMFLREPLKQLFWSEKGKSLCCQIRQKPSSTRNSIL